MQYSVTTAVNSVQSALFGHKTEVLPLAVDLDGTLVRTDTLHEAVLSAIRQSPWIALSLLLWSLSGRAYVKSRVAQRAGLKAATLPFRTELVDWLRSERATGRKIVLATAAHASIARDVAAHIGVFSEVLASDELINLGAYAKRDALVARFGMRGFDYAGNSRDDLIVWAASRIAHVAGSDSLMERARSVGSTAGKVFDSHHADFGTWLRALRIHQWVKNLLIFVPMLLAHRLRMQTFITLAVTFCAFSGMASGTYLVNDLLDLDSDRRDPVKRSRPFAAGLLPVAQGLLAALVLMASALSAAAFAGIEVLACFGSYVAGTLAYSLYLKRRPVLDVLALAGLYTLRLVTGGVAGGIYLSRWLFLFSFCVFLSLALVKRSAEVRRFPGGNRGYRQRDLSAVTSSGIAMGALAALVLALYVNSSDVTKLYGRPDVLLAVCPLLICWLARIWLITVRGGMDEDPVLFAIKDSASYAVAMGVFVIVMLAHPL